MNQHKGNMNQGKIQERSQKQKESSSKEAAKDFPPPLQNDQYQCFRVQCSECQTQICGMCKSFYHPEQSCEQFKYNQNNSLFLIVNQLFEVLMLVKH